LKHNHSAVGHWPKRWMFSAASMPRPHWSCSY